MIAEMAEAAKTGWLGKLRAGLARTRAQIASALVASRVDEALFEELEAALVSADVGLVAARRLIEGTRARLRAAPAPDAAAVRRALHEELVAMLRPCEKHWEVSGQRPFVVMIAGVNGSGKTTSIGKLAHWLRAQGHSVLLAAGDTFRAAAREQLAVWGERNEVDVIAASGKDPAAVVFDAVSAARARGRSVVLADTAGRLPTQAHLMEELRRIKRSIGKSQEGAPHEVVLVLDGTNGQNALAQLRAFDAAIGVTGVVVTKLDGSAKGGIIAAMACERAGHPVPVLFIGVGEGLDDLQAFDAREFAQALLGGDDTLSPA